MSVGGYIFVTKRIKKLEKADENKLGEWVKKSEQSLQIPDNMKIPFWLSFGFFIALGMLSIITGLNRYGLILILGSLIFGTFFINIILIYNNEMSNRSKKSYQTLFNSIIVIMGCSVIFNIPVLNEIIEVITIFIFLIFTIIGIIGFVMSMYYGIKDKKKNQPEF